MLHNLNVQAGGFTLELGKRTLLMGVMNLTPDSFSHDGRLQYSKDPVSHVRYARQLIIQGADIIDIGAESSRPGAVSISATEEIKRLLPTLKLLAPKCPVPISIDTYKPEVAKEALEAGASIINCISGCDPKRKLLKMVCKHDAAIVLMHMRGNPRTMKQKTQYGDITKDVLKELREGIEICLEIGIKKDRIIIDPGIGFAKTAGQSLRLLNELGQWHALKFPVLIGTSRKSFIASVVGDASKDRLWGTAATIALAIARGAHIVRVHDVKQMKQVARMADAITNA